MRINKKKEFFLKDVKKSLSEVKRVLVLATSLKFRTNRAVLICWPYTVAYNVKQNSNFFSQLVLLNIRKNFLTCNVDNNPQMWFLAPPIFVL